MFKSFQNGDFLMNKKYRNIVYFTYNGSIPCQKIFAIPMKKFVWLCYNVDTITRRDGGFNFRA